MRIIGGQAAGRLLKVPKGLAVRPTPDLVRQAIFNSLGDAVAEARVLELFAGSGALGLECLSRGAAEVTAVEKHPRHAAWIRANLEASGLPSERFSLRRQDAFAALRALLEAGRRFELIMADPPFGEKTRGGPSCSFSQKLLEDPALPELLAPGGLFVLGHAARDEVRLPERWRERRALRHGDSVFRILAAAAG
ncbi:MAG: 23S rRNA (adenine(2030)-N(6))-methyltransferase RlmJ [Verrucomicrobia bacterium]|nr:23S rRNA (adenine(2030)-N(6))-methyltransferase RlmJ [Verrucomicrobiota bacterium]